MNKDLYLKIDRIGLLLSVPNEWIGRSELVMACRAGSTVKFNSSTFSVVLERLVKEKFLEKRNTVIPSRPGALMIKETVEIRLTELGAQKKSEFWPEQP